ncbi:hypothetical protein LCGC14_1443750 [marine sediment metagenome]|uniref:Uncharacterized protein n=1 Tax=marine sediment metagenome TaxID=412755 RepID=A0A0F9MLU9_9ZZZZ
MTRFKDKPNIINPGGVKAPQPQMTRDQVLNALVHFMNEQMRLNQNIKHNLGIIEEYVIKPKFHADYASNFTCVSGIL